MNAGNKAGQVHGLVKYHAYSILQLEKVRKVGENRQEVRLIQLRNPHGKGGVEWNGTWSDRSSAWETLSDRTR